MLELENEIPVHFNTVYANSTVYFKGLDNKEQWLKNNSNPKYNNFFTENGWDREDSITYQFNSHGFRDSEFTEESSILALGCSFTEGIGLTAEQVWPKLLEKQLGIKVWNLGIGGSSLDTAFRMLTYYINKLNISTVFLLEPPMHRMELITEPYPISYTPGDINPNDYYKQWLLDDRNAYFNSLKNILAMRQLCNDKNIKFFNAPAAMLGESSTDRARDLEHHGPMCQKHLADYFINKYYGN